MNNEGLLNGLYLIGRTAPGKLLFNLGYKLSYLCARAYMKAFTCGDYLYLKGSYACGNWEPVVSDLDFVLIYEYDKPESDDKRISIIKKLLPVVKDVDTYTLDELKNQIRYGSFKNSDFESWMPLGRKLEIKAKRLSYPKKNILDRLDDVYFYVEWLFINLKPGNGEINSYRIACAKRNLIRVGKIIEKLATSFDFEEFETSKSMGNLRSREDVIRTLSFLLSNLDVNKLKETLGIQIDNASIEKILKRDYYKGHFSLSEELDSGKICLSRECFGLFYFLGIIDSYVLYENSKQFEDQVFNSLCMVKYALKLRDGKTNHIHEDLGDLELQKRLESSLKELDQVESLNMFENAFEKDVFITASWGQGYLEVLRKCHMNLKQNCPSVHHLHVSIDGDSSAFKGLKDLSTIRIKENKAYEGLWHKESLFNLAINVCAGARTYIFSDIDVIINSSSWIDNLLKKLKTKDVVQPFSFFIDETTGKKTLSSVKAIEVGEESFYAPGLIWAFNHSGISKLGKFFDLFHDGSNDGILFKNITKADLGVIETLTWTSKDIFENQNKESFNYGYIDDELGHVSHPAPKQYDNMIQLFNLMLPELKRRIERDHFGIWRWKDSESEFKKLFSIFLRERGLFSNTFKELISKNKKFLLNNKIAPSKLYLDETKKIYTCSGVHKLSFLTSEINEEFKLAQIGDSDSEKNKIFFELEELEAGKTYSACFVFEDLVNVRGPLCAGLVNCFSDDIVFESFTLNKKLSAMGINFYAFENFKDPKVYIEFKGEEDLEFNFKSFQIDVNDDQHKENWSWIGENKSKEVSSGNECLVAFQKTLKPTWHKVSIKLGNLKSSQYKVSILAGEGQVLTSPRIQKNIEGYISLVFKIPVVMTKILIKFEFETEEEFEKDIVYFVEKKIS